MTLLLQRAAHRLSIDNHGNRRDALGYDWQELDAIFGGDPNAPEPPPLLPVTAITRKQGELAIYSAGLWGAYKIFTDAMTVPDRIVWDNAQLWRIDNQLIIAGVEAIGAGDMLQDLFTASTL